MAHKLQFQNFRNYSTRLENQAMEPTSAIEPSNSQARTPLNSEIQHRTRSRIRDLGEVFTSEKYVEDMLTLINKSGKRRIWSSLETVFFEPCCGHGNIVLAIYEKRLDAIHKKATGSEFQKSLFSVANAVNTLWAIDIDELNITQCRQRLLRYTFDFLSSHSENYSDLEILNKHP